MLTSGDACDAHITRGLDTLIKVENTCELRMRAGVVGVVGIVVELNEVSGVVDTSESLVWKRAQAQMDHHGSLG
jgi:hypothetical protein